MPCGEPAVPALALEQRQIRGEPVLRIDDDPQRLAQGLFGIGGFDRGRQLVPAHGEGGVIRQHGFGAGEHRIVASPQPLHVATRLRGGDPLALAARHGGAAIQAGAELDRHLRKRGPHPLEKPGLSASASLASRPKSVLMPASESIRRPRPPT